MSPTRPVEQIRVGRRLVEITNPRKQMFTAPTVTKIELVRHYESVAEVMIPLVRERPLALQVYPQGTDARGYFLKSVPSYFPDWIRTAEVPKKGGSNTEALANDAATLVYLPGQNVVTMHTWLSRVDELRRPDRLIVDLDPSPGVSFAEIRACARDAGERLRDAGLVPFAMVTGSRGIHVVCPLRRDPATGFAEVHSYARSLAEAMVAANPEQLTLEWHVAKRGARIYLDINRINYGQHAVAPYSVRAKPGAPVAMPIHWQELNDRRLEPDRWTVRTASRRVRDEGDAWQGIGRHARRLPATAAVTAAGGS